MLDRYRELAAKVDAFFARVEARHRGDLRCAAGCHDCCLTRLTVTGLEADAIAEGVAALPADRRAALAATARRPEVAGAPRCAALADDGRCLIYEVRPLVCRSHGLPIRLERRGLPVVESCFKNFTERGPAAADPDCILDQTTLSTTLGLLDRAHAAAGGRAAGERIDLAALLVERTA